MKFAAMLTAVAVPLCACSPKDADKPQITVYAAASLNEAISEIAADFSQAHDVDVALNFASSGSLAKQILATGQADIYLSANPRWMDEVVNAGRTVEGTRSDLLSNQLVIIATKDAAFTLASPVNLPALDFQYLVIGDPAHVPAGQYAKHWLESRRLPGGKTLWDAVQGRLSPMPDVRAALMQVRGNSRLVGMVYRTDYQLEKDKLKLLYAIPLEQSGPILYSVAEITGGSATQAKAFLDYLHSAEAKRVFEHYGFIHMADE